MKKVGTFTEEGIIQWSSIYVHPLKSLQHKKHRHLTENDKLENRCTLVTNVGSIFHIRVVSVPIWIFIQVSTSAQNVANVIKTAVYWQNTGEVIQERNRLNVLFVANDLQDQVTLLHTAEFTLETNHTNVACHLVQYYGINTCAQPINSESLPVISLLTLYAPTKTFCSLNSQWSLNLR